MEFSSLQEAHRDLPVAVAMSCDVFFDGVRYEMNVYYMLQENELLWVKVCRNLVEKKLSKEKISRGVPMTFECIYTFEYYSCSVDEATLIAL
jgi:hypothetical protein